MVRSFVLSIDGTLAQFKDMTTIEAESSLNKSSAHILVWQFEFVNNNVCINAPRLSRKIGIHVIIYYSS